MSALPTTIAAAVSSLELLVAIGAVVSAAVLAFFMTQPRDVRTLLSANLSEAYLRNKTVWITGASSGIGAELAVQIAALRCNARVVISARRVDRLTALAKRLNAQGGVRVEVVACDVGDLVALQRAYGDVVRLVGAVDVLVNNAGIPLRRLVVDSDEGAADQLRVLDVNLRSHVLLTTLVVKDMVARGSGHVVAVSSLVGHLTVPGFAAYIATKRGMQGYYDSLRLELLGKRTGVAVTLVCPGTIATGVWDHEWNRSERADSYMDQHFKDNCLAVDKCVRAMLIAVSNRAEEVWITANALEKIGVYSVYYLPPIGNWFIRTKLDDLCKEF